MVVYVCDSEELFWCNLERGVVFYDYYFSVHVDEDEFVVDDSIFKGTKVRREKYLKAYKDLRDAQNTVSHYSGILVRLVSQNTQDDKTFKGWSPTAIDLYTKAAQCVEKYLDLSVQLERDVEFSLADLQAKVLDNVAKSKKYKNLI